MRELVRRLFRLIFGQPSQSSAVSRDHLRQALGELLADPYERNRLLRDLVALVPVAGGVCTISPSEITAGNFSCAGDYGFTGGKLGVGTASPFRRFHVVGAAGEAFQARIESGPTNSVALEFYQGSTSRGLIATGATTFDLYNGDVAGGPRISIRQDTGNVGIGTFSQARRLHVVDNSLDDAQVRVQSAIGKPAGIELYEGATLRGLFRADAGTVDIYNGSLGVPRLSIRQNNGDVGIGTIGPARRLHVVGASTENFQLRVESGVGKAIGVELFEGTTSRGLIAAGATTVDLYNGDVAGGPRISIGQQTGNVGIGVSDRLSKLTVKGRISFTATGTVSTTAGSATVTGSGTKFVTEIGIGDRITIGSENRSVASIASDTSLAVNVIFGTTNSGAAMTVLQSLFRLDDASGNVRLIVTHDGWLEVGVLNRIISLRPTGGNDSTQIQNAIDALGPTNGGIIMLLPGTYSIQSTIFCKKNGVKIRGYGGALAVFSNNSDQPVAATKLLWSGGAATILEFTPQFDDDEVRHVHDVEVSDLLIDGGGTAQTGMYLNQVLNSYFGRLSFRGMNPAGGIGIEMNCRKNGHTNWNLFENCSCYEVSKGVILGGDSAFDVNSAHNTFVGLSVQFRGTDAADAGIWLKECDNNSFYRTYIHQDAANGFGVVVENPHNAGDNYFYHLQAGGNGFGGFRVKNSGSLLTGNEGTNFVFGYDQSNGQLAPTTDSANPARAFVGWTNSIGEMHGFTVF